MRAYESVFPRIDLLGSSMNSGRERALVALCDTGINRSVGALYEYLPYNGLVTDRTRPQFEGKGNFGMEEHMAEQKPPPGGDPGQTPPPQPGGPSDNNTIDIDDGTDEPRG